jgi:hypothetical protein
MFDTVNRKKEIFDKRPEDHPHYPEEWRIFWEKRYKELQAQGKDADTYDYKPDWIPYWSKKVEELYKNEVDYRTRLKKPLTTRKQIIDQDLVTYLGFWSLDGVTHRGLVPACC